MTMETWRLSRIEEELERLDFSADPTDGATPDSWQDFNGNHDEDSDGELPPPPPPLSYNSYYKSEPPPPQSADEGIYSKLVIRPPYKSPTDEERSKQAVGFITEKYDSLGKVRPSLPGAVASVAPPPPPSNANLSLNLLRTAPVTNPGSGCGAASGGEAVGYSDQQYKQQPLTKPAEVGDLTRFPYQDLHEGFSHGMDVRSPNSVHPRTLSAFGSRQDGLPPHNTGLPGLTEQDVVQVEMFFKGHKTEVFVCQSMANLYFGVLDGSPSKGGPGAKPGKWAFVKSGIPVLVLDSGESRRQRRLSLIMAERGTGFVLWKDVMNHLSEYKAQHATFHTMHLSSDHTRVAGFSFDDAAAAAEFVHKITTLTSNPDDHLLLLSGKKKKKKESKFKFMTSKVKYKAPNKADISTPCCFTHITKLDRSDGMSILGSGGDDAASRGLQSPRPCLGPNSAVATRT